MWRCQDVYLFFIYCVGFSVHSIWTYVCFFILLSMCCKNFSPSTSLVLPFGIFVCFMRQLFFTFLDRTVYIFLYISLELSLTLFSKFLILTLLWQILSAKSCFNCAFCIVLYSYSALSYPYISHCFLSYVALIPGDLWSSILM
jgi:hypothetical protein